MKQDLAFKRLFREEGRRRARFPFPKAVLCAPLLALAGIGLSGCEGGNTEATPASRTATEQHSVPAPLPRIVSLNPCTDAILAEVTAPGQLIAISGYSHNVQTSSMPQDLARRYRGVSGSVEEVAALAPDIVVTSTFEMASTVNAMADLGLQVEREPMIPSFEAAREQVVRLAALARQPERGRALLARLDAAMEKSAAHPGTEALPALVWESGGLVAGDDTLVVDLLQRTGFVNSAGARGLSQAEFLPLEVVLSDPPRMIFAVGNPNAEEDRMLHHPSLALLEQTRKIRLERSLLWCAGPTIPRLLDRLAQARRAVDTGPTALVRVGTARK